MAGVRLVKVKKVYPGGVEAVPCVDLEIPDREFTVLVGPSGCGKSTVLRMIAGLETITEGEIYIGDRLVNDLPPKDRNIAMVFQNYALYPHMTVRQNLAFGLKLRKTPPEEIKKKVEAAAEILDIPQLLDRKPKALSGGQRQRVAVGRSIVRDPDVFLFDEPLSNLDAKLRVQMRAEISKLHRQLKATMIYVTHDQTEAMTMGDRIVVLKDGLIHQVDPPLELYRHPADRFVAGFIGSPPMNFLEGKIVEDDGGLYFDEGAFRFKIVPEQAEKLAERTGQVIVCGVRPEDLHLAEEVESADPKKQFEAEVDEVEPLGSEMYVYFTAGKSRLVGKLVAVRYLKVGEKVPLLIDTEKVHFFDPESGKTVAGR
jgi:multiple sugar transport system ATP-binding protein